MQKCEGDNAISAYGGLRHGQPATYLQVTLFFSTSALMWPCLSTTTCSNWRSNMFGVGPCATNLDFNVMVWFDARSRVRSVWLVLSLATYLAPVVWPMPFRCATGRVVHNAGSDVAACVHRLDQRGF